MRTPLIRAGGGQPDLERIYDTIAEERENLRKMIDTANATEDDQQRRHRGIIGARSPAGDEERLRGIPAIARGVAGAVPGSNPQYGDLRRLL